MNRSARCHCGQVSVACHGEPRKISMCHCIQCQHRTGSLFSIAVFFDRHQVTIGDDQSRIFERPSASGFPVAFHFCPTCGTSLWWEARRMPDLIGVAAGCLIGPLLPPPEQAVWTQEQHHWLPLPADLTGHAQNSNTAPRPA